MEKLDRLFLAFRTILYYRWYDLLLFSATAALVVFSMARFILGRPDTIPRFTDKQLAEQSIAQGREILQFLDERGRHEPAPYATDMESSSRNLAYTAETLRLFYLKFGGKALALAEDFKRRGMAKDDLVFRTKFPTNPIGIRSVGQELEQLGTELSAK